MNYYSETGVLTSPNYPEPYNNRENCNFFIKIALAESIRLVFHYFVTEHDKDILIFGPGPLIDLYLYDPENFIELHGNLTVLPIEDRTYEFNYTNQVWLNWYTDRGFTSNGFFMTWEAGKYNISYISIIRSKMYYDNEKNVM